MKTGQTDVREKPEIIGDKPEMGDEPEIEDQPEVGNNPETGHSWREARCGSTGAEDGRGELRMAMTPARRQTASVVEMSLGQEVAVVGALDVNSVAEVRFALRDILDRGVGDLLVHLAQAEVHDATGLGVIVGAHHRARLLGRRLVLVDVSPRLDRLLRASRLHRVLARGPGTGAVTVLPPASMLPPLDLPPARVVLPAAEGLLPLGDNVLPFTD